MKQVCSSEIKSIIIAESMEVCRQTCAEEVAEISTSGSSDSHKTELLNLAWVFKISWPIQDTLLQQGQTKSKQKYEEGSIYTQEVDLFYSCLCTIPARGELVSRECSDTGIQMKSPFFLWWLTVFKVGPSRSAQDAEVAEQMGQGLSCLRLHPGGEVVPQTSVHLSCQGRAGLQGVLWPWDSVRIAIFSLLTV